MPPSPTRVTLQLAHVFCRHQGHTKPFSDVITLRINRCPAVTSPWYSGSVMLVAWENAALGNSTCADRFATRSSGSGAGCARIPCRMGWPEIRADARQEENEKKAAAEQPCRAAKQCPPTCSYPGTAVSRRYEQPCCAAKQCPPTCSYPGTAVSRRY